MRFGFSAKKRAVLRAPSGPASQRSECSLGETSAIIPSPMVTTAKVYRSRLVHVPCMAPSLLLALSERHFQRPLGAVAEDSQADRVAGLVVAQRAE